MGTVAVGPQSAVEPTVLHHGILAVAALFRKPIVQSLYIKGIQGFHQIMQECSLAFLGKLPVLAHGIRRSPLVIVGSFHKVDVLSRQGLSQDLYR